MNNKRQNATRPTAGGRLLPLGISHMIAIAILGAGSQQVLAQDPVVTQEMLAHWYQEFTSRGPKSNDARDKLKQHSAATVAFLIDKMKEPGAGPSQYIYYIGQLSEEVIPVLCKEAANPESPVRAAVFEALAGVGRLSPAYSKMRAELALATIGDDEPAVLKQVLALVGSVGKLAIQNMCKPAPIGPRCAVALGRMPRAPLPALIAATRDGSALIRGRAVELIEKIPGASAIEELAGMVNDQSLAVQDEAWQSLARRFAADRSSTAVILPLLNRRLTAPIGPHARATYDDLRHRASLVASLRKAGKAALPLLVAVIELPTPPEYWLATYCDAIRGEALLGLKELGADAKPVVSTLEASLSRETDSLQLHVLALQALRNLDLQPGVEAKLCWQAYKVAQEASLPDGMSKGHQRSFRSNQRELVQVALEGLTSTDDQSVYAELVRASAGELAPTVATAAMVRVAWHRPEVQQQALATLTRLGNDPIAGEATLLKALTQRVCLGDTHEPVVEALLAELVKYAVMPRKQASARHYLHKVSLHAIEKIGPGLNEKRRRQLLEELVTGGNRKMANTQGISKLCIRMDPRGALDFRNLGSVGQQIVSDITHLAPELMVADLDAADSGSRQGARQRMKSYSVSSPETLNEFTKLLRKPKLHEPRLVFEALLKVRPGPEFVDLLNPWVVREPTAYACLAAIRPPQKDLILELLANAVPMSRKNKMETARTRQIFKGLRSLSLDGAVYIPGLLKLAERLPEYANLVSRTLPHCGLKGIRALETMDPQAITPLSSSLRLILSREGGSRLQLQVLSYLLSTGKLPQGMEQSIRNASFSTNPKVQVMARLVLANLAPESPASIDNLLRALTEGDSRLRRFAANSLAKQPTNPRIRAYMYWLQDDQDKRVREIARAMMR